MSTWLGLNGSHTAKPIIYSGIQVSSSRMDMPLTLFWGQRRLSTDALWYNGFKKHAQSVKGKGGGGKGGGQYTYSADTILGLGEGPIDSIDNIWQSGSTTTTTSLAALNMTFFSGTAIQTPWSYVTSKYPAQARSYARTSYLGAPQLSLGSSATIPDYGFECVRSNGFAYTHTTGGWINPSTMVQGSAIDVLLSDCATDLLTSQQYGYGFTTAQAGDTTQWGTYMRAQGLFYSPLLKAQEKVTAVLDRWAQLSNSWIYWSGTAMQYVPLADSAITGNGVTFTPDNDVAYALTVKDFADKESPVKVTRAPGADCYNRTVLQFTDRTIGYVSNPVEFKDQTLIDLYGRRDSSSTSADDICDPGVARIAVQLIGKRAAYIRNNYSFKTGYRFIRLLPGSVVTLTTPRLSAVRVRIKTVEEGEDGVLSFQAEEFPGTVGTYTVATQSSTGNVPTTPDENVLPGSVNTPAIVEPDSAFTGGKPVLLVAASGGANWGGCKVYVSFDGTGFDHIGDINSPAPQGTLTAPLASHADPDTVDTLSVDCTQSQTVPQTVTTADADALRTLSMVCAQPTLIGSDLVMPTNGELLAFGTVTTVSTYAADLTYLRRGKYGTSPSAHSSGDQFSVVDVLGASGTTLSYDLPAQYVGQPIWVKLCSFNAFGNSLEDLSAVSAYKYTPTGAGYGSGSGGVPGTPAAPSVTPGSTSVLTSWAASPSTDNVTQYTVWRAPGTGAAFGSASAIWSGQATSYLDQSVSPSTGYTYFLTATNAVGTSSNSTGTNATTSSAAAVNATEIQGVPVDATAPTNNQVLAYDSGTSSYKPVDQSGGGGSSIPGADKTIDRFPLDLYGGSGGGGGGSGAPSLPIGWPANLDIGTTSAPSTNFLRLKAVYVPAGTTLTGVVVPIFSTTATAHMTPVLYDSDGTAMAPFTLLEGGTTVVGVTPGLLKLPFAAPYTAASDTVLYIGYINTTAAPTMLSYSVTSYNLSTSSDTPPATESGWSHSGTQIGFWGY